MPDKSEAWFKFEQILNVIWSMKPVWCLNLNFDIGENEELSTLSHNKSNINHKVKGVLILNRKYQILDSFD